MTAYEMRISDWSSDVCSSDLPQRSRLPCRRSVARTPGGDAQGLAGGRQGGRAVLAAHAERRAGGALWRGRARSQAAGAGEALRPAGGPQSRASREPTGTCRGQSGGRPVGRRKGEGRGGEGGG